MSVSPVASVADKWTLRRASECARAWATCAGMTLRWMSGSTSIFVMVGILVVRECRLFVFYRLRFKRSACVLDLSKDVLTVWPARDALQTRSARLS